MKKRVLSMLMALALCLTLLPAPVRAAEDTPAGGAIVQEEQEEATPAISEQAAENGIAVQDGRDSTVENAVAAVNPDCPVCSAENADLSANKGTEQATPLMAAAAGTEETISGNVTWENRNITTPVVVKGDTTITLKGENSITITETAYTAALDMYSANLTIQGGGSLTVNVPKGKRGIEDGSWSDTAGGTLTIKDGVKITTNGGLYGLSAKTIVIENGTLNLNSGYGIVTASLTMNRGTLYATGKYGAIWSRKGTTRSIDPSLTILYSDEQNANTDNMSVGTAADTTREEEVKTIYIAKMAPRASLTVGAQQGTLQESLGSQTATFSVTGSKVKINTLNVEWVGDHPGLTAVKSSDGATITVTADDNVKEGRYKLKLTADSEKDFSPAKATATATVTVAAAPRNPITIKKQPQVVYEKLDGESVAVVDVKASLASGQSGKITYQWYVNGTEFQGTGSGSYNKIVLTKSNLTPVEGRDWEYSGQVYCKLSYNNYTVDTKTVTVTVNTCTHAKYTHDGKCQQCGEPCLKEVLFIDEDGIPYSSELGNNQAMVGSRLISGGTFYFVRDIDAILRAGGGDGTNKKDLTLDLQGHKVKALDLQDCPYNSVTIKNGTIEGIGEVIATKGPTVLILDSVTIGQGLVNNLFTLTVKGDCVFQHQVNFLGKTQLQGGTFQCGINAELGEEALALLADGYAFADAGSNEILNVSNVDIQDRAVKVVAHTDQYQNGKCVCGRVCDHAGKVDKDGYCTFCKALVEAFEIGGKRYTSLENALAAAQDGDTITLRGPLDIENVEPIEISKNIVLDLNEFTLSKSAENALLRILGSNVAIINGKVLSTCTSKPAVAVEVGKFNHTGAKLTLDNVTLEGSVGGGTGSGGTGLSILTGSEAVVTSGTFPGGIYTEGALTMSGGSAAQLELGALNGIPVTLSGGSFDSIEIENGASYQSLLAAGYAYQKQDGTLLKLSEMKENTAVTVVKCSHPDEHSGGNVCPYCGYAAEVTKTDGSISYYLTADAAIAAAGGGTVKLLANAGEITIGSPLKLNLNGKTAAKLTVTGDVTLASLLPEGYAFKSGSTWISDLSSKELTNVSMAKILIKSMDYETKMSMTYGGAGTLLVKVTKETGTGAVSFQWYKVEDGKETAVGSATTKNQFDLSAQKLSAGQHTFRFSAVCDGYEKMSKDIVVTVQKATPIVVTVPTVAEREYNPDAALTGSDMTGGRVIGADGKELAGTWSFTGMNIVPTVNNKGYQAVFAPTDTANYNTVTRTITVKVTKTSPVIAEKPTATALTYGQTLSDSTLTGGKVTYKTADGTEVAGTFAWKNSNIKPTAADSGKTEYDVTFTPSDTDNYNAVDMKIILTVNKAAKAPNMPENAMAPAHSTQKIGDIILPEGWSWQESDKDTALADGVAVTATAVYTGADKGNYETESVSITITRSECDHTHTEIRNQREATCKEEGYTGDIYCKDCGEKLVTGTATGKKPHTVGTPATCVSKAVCSVCGETFGEVDATNHVHTTVKNRKEATCMQTGYTGDTYCTDCNKLLSTGKELAALGHDYKATVTKQPTTTEEGVRTYTCTRCNSSYTESIAKLPEEQHTHNYTGSITKEATCTEAGVRTYTCSCGDSYTENIPATGHSYVSKVTKAATTTEEGIMTYICSKCGHSYTQPIAKVKSDDSNKDNGSQNQKPQSGTDNGNQNQKPQPDTDNGKDNGTSIKPYIKDDSGKEGWDVIKPQLEEAKAGDTVTVAMNGTTVVPKDVIDSIKGKDTTLVLDMGNGLSWKINGKDITDASGDIDFDVTAGADAGKSIPVDVINNVTGERSSVNLTLAYDGEFGFTATLTVNMESKNAGLYANLFYYNEQTGELEFISAGQIDPDGNVELVFTHASDYTIVVDTRIMSDNGQADNKSDETIPAPKTDDSTSKYAWNNTIIIIIGICIMLIVIGAIFYVRKKSGSEE